MGFAAGFAAGYEAVDKGRREEEARKKQIEDEAKRLKEEQDKVFNSAGQEIASHNKLVSDLTINMAKAEDETQYNTYASELKAANDNFTSLKTAKLDNYKDTPLAASLDKLYSNARMSNAETVVQVDIKDYNGKPVSVYVPESIANNKDSAILMQNGRIGLAGKNNIGADGKIAGYQPTDIAPIKFKEEKPKFEKSWDSSKNAYVMTRVEEGSIIKDKPTTYAPTEGDKEYSSYVQHQKSLGLPVLDRYEYKQESKGGKVDATYQTKFDNAYNKLKKDNPDMDEIDLRSLADESIRSTQSERVSNKIDNMEKAIKAKLKVNQILDANIIEARKDKNSAKLLDDYFNEKAKDKFGQTWQDNVVSASESIANADKVFDAGNVYAQDIIKGKSGVNVVNRLFDNSIGSYLNKNLTSEEKLNASKDLASIMNVVRNEQFGAVVPMAEQTNFNDAATNLAKSSPDIVRGTISMLKQQKETMQTSKDVLGTELFTVKFGDKIEKLDDKISKLESTLKTNTKSQNVSDKKKPLSEIFK